MKIVLLTIILILIYNSIYSQSINSFIAHKLESQNKFDKSLKWYLKSEKSLDENIKPEFYQKIYELAIKIDSGYYGLKSDYLNLALKYHLKYLKLKKNDFSIIENQKTRLIEETKEGLILLIKSKKRNNELYSFYKENSFSALSEMILTLYDLSKIKDKSENEWRNFYAAYNSLFSIDSNVNLSPASEKIFFECIEEILDESFLLTSIDIIRKTSVLNFFKKSYGKKLMNKVLVLFKELEQDSNNDFMVLKDLWELEIKLFKINPELLESNIFKTTYIYKIINSINSSSEGSLNDFVLKNNCTDLSNYFDTIPFYYNRFSYLTNKQLILNNELIQFVYLNAFENKLNEDGVRNQLNLFKKILNSDSIFRKLNSSLLLKEHLTRNYNHYSRYASTCISYHDFDKTLVADLLFDVAKQRISNFAQKNEFLSATNEFFNSIKMFPNRNWKDQKKWFYTHFKNRIKLNETSLMGKEALIATCLFINDKEFNLLIDQYRKLELEFTFEKNNIQPDSWNGNSKNCDCGSMSNEYLNAGLESIKFFRRYIGLPDSIYLSKYENKYAQCGALIMYANNYLTHHPTINDKCYTNEGYYGASHGNLFMGSAKSGACISSYVNDHRQNETGHRAWVISPNIISYGFGSTFNSNCLVCINTDKREDFDNFYKNISFSWPPAGSVSYELLKFSDNWSFALFGADFANASVKVFYNKIEKAVKITYVQAAYNGGYGEFSYINYFIGNELTNNNVKKGEYDILIENVKDAYGFYHSYKYSVQLK